MSKLNPGLDPIEYNVVILPDKVEEVTKGGIIRPDMVKDQEQTGATRGVVVAISDLAYNFDPNYEDNLPIAVGDRVAFARYAGATFEGDDGETYRVVKDKDVVGRVK